MQLIWNYHDDEMTDVDREFGTESEMFGAIVSGIVFGVHRTFIEGEVIVMWGVRTCEEPCVVIEPDRRVKSVEVGKQRCQDWLDDRIEG